MPINRTPAQIADKWKRNLTNAGTDIALGVNAVTENPATKAIEQQQKMVTNWNAAVQDGTWARNLGRVTLTDWKRQMIDVGIPRIQQGTTKGSTKLQAYLTEAIPYMDNLMAQIDQMPSTTLQENIQRAVAWMQGMSEFERS